MAARGRKSAASLSVVAAKSIDGRVSPPDDLTDFQKEVWDRTVANEAADVFKTAALQQLLKEYCRHVETADRLNSRIEVATQEGSSVPLQDLNILIRLRDCETKALSNLATKLRLTNQSRYTPQAAATASKKAGDSKPWQMAG